MKEQLISCLLNEKAREALGEALLQQRSIEDLESAIEELALSLRRARAEREKAPILRAMINAWHGDDITAEAAQEFIADYCDDLAQGVIQDENPESEFSAFLEFFMEGMDAISEAQHAALHRAYYHARFKNIWEKAS